MRFPAAVCVPFLLTAAVLLMAAEPAAPDAAKAAEGVSFPDGRTHDFGVVKPRRRVTHVFRVVNTSGCPLEVVDLRWG